jgi:isocitrate dehydrogenase (NAD+)
MSDAERITVVVLGGDETGQELLEEALQVLDPAVCQGPLDMEHYNLSLQNRRVTSNEIVHQAARAMCQSGLGLKSATSTPSEPIAIYLCISKPSAALSQTN